MVERVTLIGTVSVVLPDTVPVDVLSTAMIVAVPGAMAKANPLEPAALLMVATLVPVMSEELQVTCVVRSWVVPSE